MLLRVREYLKSAQGDPLPGFVTAEKVGRDLGVDDRLVQQAFARLRTEGLLGKPVNRAPGNTWRGGGYDEYSGWRPTLWPLRERLR